MLRIQPIADAKAAESYYSKSDGGYYLQADDLGREWGGKGAATLGLSGPPDYEQFKRLIHGLDPPTGEQLTAKLVEHRIPAWDVNLHCSKGVTVALECGDDRIQGVFWEAVREAMADIETLATTRVRKRGKQEDRVTGNLVWYAVEHPETRPAKEDRMPDPNRHVHVVVFHLTYDKAEGEGKAVKFRPIMDLHKYFDRRFNQRFAHKLVELGYDVEAKTRMMRQAVPGIEKPVVVLAPSADASRKTRRAEGFEDADTVARFLIDKKFQQRARKPAGHERPTVLRLGVASAREGHDLHRHGAGRASGGDPAE